MVMVRSVCASLHLVSFFDGACASRPSGINAVALKVGTPGIYRMYVACLNAGHGCCTQHFPTISHRLPAASDLFAVWAGNVDGYDKG